MKTPDWYVKIKRFSIKGRMFWYITDDAGFSWQKISTKTAMKLIDKNQGVIL